MPTGKYRYRRSFGNVGSLFRGARPDTYPLTRSLLSLYPATAAYSAYDLGNKRGSVTEAEGTVINPVQRWRRDSDDALQMFTAKDIANGAALDFANHGTTDLYNSVRYFNGTSTIVRCGSDSSLQVQATDSVVASASFAFSDASSGNFIQGWRMQTTSGAGWWMRTDATTGVLSFYVYDGTSITNCIGTLDVCDGDTHEAVITHDGSGSFSITIDGVLDTISASQNNSGVITYSEKEFSVGAGDRSSISDPAMGIIYAVSLSKNSTPVVAYTGLGTSVTAWEDTIGSNDGTEANGATFTGQGYDAYLLTEYDQHDTGMSHLYGKTALFDGNDYVDFGDKLPILEDSNNSWTIEFDFFISSLGFYMLFAQQDGGGFDYKGVAVYANGATLSVDISNSTSNQISIRNTEVLSLNEVHKVIVTYDGSKSAAGVTIDVDGETGVLVDQDSLTIDDIKPQSNLSAGVNDLVDGGDGFLSGSVWGITVKDGGGVPVFATLGDGITNAEWVDAAGSLNGTVYGSPVLFQGQGVAYDLTQTTAANQPLVVKDGALTVDGESSYSAIFDIGDDLDFTGAFTGLTTANVYAVTDNAGTVTLDTLTAQDITLVTSLDGLLTSLTYDKVTFVAIYPDATNQAEIQAKILTMFPVS